MQSKEIVSEDRNPFAKRRIKEPADRRTGKDDKRQAFQPGDVVRLWQAAEAKGDIWLTHSIRIAAYSGARIEGIVGLRVEDVRLDRQSGIEFIHFLDKPMPEIAMCRSIQQLAT